MNILSSLFSGLFRASAVPAVATEGETPLPLQPPALKAGDVLCGQVRVLSGDCLVIGGVMLRLAGIEAPRLDAPYGREARYALVRLCAGEVVWAQVQAAEDGSARAVCHLPGGRDLSAEMVRAGLALDVDGTFRRMEPAAARRRFWQADLRQRDTGAAAAAAA
jgi:micrococcal nuclease